MQLIAHRVFADNRPIELPQFDGPVAPHGVELDIRADSEGRPQVYHAPVFNVRRSRRVRIPKSLQAAEHFLTSEAPDLECLMLDIKSAAAAEAVGRYVAENGMALPLVFNCWHEDDVATLRRYVPDAVIYYVIVPIVSRRVPRGRFRDLFVCNSYPFVSSRSAFTPRHDKANQHNVNVKLLSRKRSLRMTLPYGISGICVHKLFYSDDLVEMAGARGIGVAVYGLSQRNLRRLRRLEGKADYAIVGWT
ncbi:MAG: hypothetical protein AAFV19_00585 [Pseudomonadota bacterium]